LEALNNDESKKEEPGTLPIAACSLKPTAGLDRGEPSATLRAPSHQSMGAIIDKRSIVLIAAHLVETIIVAHD
jgi:hypothetical protein